MRRYAIAIILMIVCAAPVICDPPSLAVSGAAVQAVSDNFNFGNRSELDTSPINHVFILKAVGNAPVTIDRLQPSCHCTHADADRASDDFGRFTIKPGQSVDISVTVDATDVVPGEVEKDVYVFANGESTPTITLHVAGRIKPAVSFAPSELDFGKLEFGATATKNVAVTIDKRLLAPGESPILTCANSAVHIATFGVSEVIAGAYRYTYHVAVVSDKVQGMLKASLLLAAPQGKDRDSQTWSMPLTATIVSPTAKK